MTSDLHNFSLQLLLKGIVAFNCFLFNLVNIPSMAVDMFYHFED